MKNAPPSGKRLILAGAGHAHLVAASAAADFVKRGVEPVLIDPGAFWYSGMATGMLAGQYAPEEDQIDPERLITGSGGRFLRDRVAAIDAPNRRVLLASGDTLGYDVLSLNIGSRVRAPFPGTESHAIPVKPIRDLWDLRVRLEHRFANSPEPPPELAVIGGGPTGCEVAACAASLARRRDAKILVRLLTRSDRILAGFSPSASERMTRELARLGVEVLNGREAVELRDGAVVDAEGRFWRSDYLIAATGLEAPELLRDSGLPVTTDGSLRITDTLRSSDDDRIFASGDCASLEGSSLPKLGVFGVRQAPVLLRNLLNTLDGASLEPYHPQSKYLMILNTGDGRALALYGGRHVYGRPAYWLKHLIDKRFLRKYR